MRVASAKDGKRKMDQGDRAGLANRPEPAILAAAAQRRVIEEGDFNAALLAVRPGDMPVSEALKNALVGDDNR